MESGAHGIDAVTFDLWETLLFEKDGASSRRTDARCRNLANALKGFGVSVSDEQVSSALNEIVTLLLNVWDTNADVTHLDQIDMIIKHMLGGSIVVEQQWLDSLVSAYVSPIIEVPPYLNPDARKVLEWLKGQRKSIGLICNTGLTPGIGLRKLLEGEKVSEYFDLMVFSDEIGIRKPDAKIFDLAAKKLDLKPCKIVHVGDNMKSDVWGAKSAGFKAMHLSGIEGRDRIAESDPESLVSLSRNLGSLKGDQIAPDRTITRLREVIEAVGELGT